MTKHIQAQDDDKAKTIIINTMAQECKVLKQEQKAPDSFTSASLAMEQILGEGIHNLSEDTYLRVLSLCYESDTKEKGQKIFYE